MFWGSKALQRIMANSSYLVRLCFPVDVAPYTSITDQNDEPQYDHLSVFRKVSTEFVFVFVFVFVIISSVFRQVSAEFVEACASYINSLEPSAHPPFLLYWPLSHRQRKEYFLHLPATHRRCALHHWHPCDIYPYCKVKLSM